MYFLIYGEDGFRARRALGQARQQFQMKRDASGLNVIRLKAADGLIRAQEEMFASPFLAERKLVILEGFCGLGKADQETLTGLMGRMPDTTAAIFFESAGGKELAKSPLFALLKKQKFTAEHPALTPAEASRFVAAEAAEAGLKFELAAVRKLIEAVGADSWRLHQETRRLCALAAGQGQTAVSAANVEETVRGGQEESIFAYVDACTDGRGTRAMAALEKLLASGQSELQVVAMLRRHFRIVTMARDLMSRGISQAKAATKLGVHPFAAQKAWRAALKFDSRFLGICLRRLAQMEQDLKTGATLPQVSLDVFTAELTEKACAAKAR